MFFVIANIKKRFKKNTWSFIIILLSKHSFLRRKATVQRTKYEASEQMSSRNKQRCALFIFGLQKGRTKESTCKKYIAISRPDVNVKIAVANNIPRQQRLSYRRCDFAEESTSTNRQIWPLLISEWFSPKFRKDVYKINV